jgi:hypothetical protein
MIILKNSKCLSLGFSFAVFKKFASTQLDDLVEDTGSNDTNQKVRTAWQHSGL